MASVAGALAARGHEVDFSVCDARGPRTPPAGCRFRPLAGRASRGHFGKRLLAHRLRREYRGRAADLFVSTLPFADEVAALAAVGHHACRVANTLSAELARLPARKAKRRAARYRWLYGSRPVVAVSQGVAQDLRERFGAEHVRVIPNPLDAQRIRELAAEPCAELPAEPFLLHVARYAAQKRHDLLLEAYAQLPDAPRLVLLTPDREALACLVSQKGLADRVRVIGFRSNPYPWMAAAEALVLCSDHEGLPAVLLEALACGTRVVSTDCPSGPREILVGALGRWLVPCGDAQALAAAIGEALRAPRPAPAEVQAALAPYAPARVYAQWEELAADYPGCAG